MKKCNKFLISLAWMTILSMALGAAWTTKRLTNNSGYSGYPDIAVNGANVYVTWSNDMVDNAEIFFRRSTDSGANWQAAKRLTSNSGFSGYPAVAVNGSTIFIVWEGHTPGNNEIYFRSSTDGGATWQAAKRLTNNAGNSHAPRVAVSGANLCVVWWDDTPGNFEIYFRKSLDGGATWQTAVRLTNNSGGSWDPDIVGYGSNFYVVWDDVSSTNNEVYFRRSIDGGANWQNQKQLTNNAGDSEYASIAVGGLLGANLYVVWDDDSSGNDEIYFMKSTDKGVTWGTAKNLTNNAGESQFPNIAVSGSNVYVTWYDSTSGNDEIYVRKSADGGDTWQAAQRLTYNTGASYDPIIALSTSNRYVTYFDNTPGNYEIYVKYAPL